jgi:hypothetical protein
LEKRSKILGRVKRPLVPIEIARGKEWIPVDEVLADTGADITLLPRFIGELVVDDITKGKYVEIKGVVPSAALIAFIHDLRLRVAGKVFKTKVGIADSNDIPPILGRFKSLDLFGIGFQKGREMIFE